MLPPHVLPDGVVIVWVIDLQVESAPMARMLSRDERERADRFATAALRRRFVVAHSALRTILATYVGETSPSAVPIVVDSRGKPALAGTGLSFNLSHSDDLAVCALAGGGRIGVDIERLRPTDNSIIVSRVFSAQESAEILNAPTASRDVSFLRRWTYKEALVKATGEGLAALAQLDDDGRVWWTRAFEPAEGFVGTVAHDRPIDALEYHEWRAPKIAAVAKKDSSDADFLPGETGDTTKS